MQMKTIYILWWRQMMRYIRTRSRVLAGLGQPLLFFIALGFGFGPVFARAGAGNYLQFLTPGIIAMTIVFTAVFTGMEIIWDKQVGFLKETLVAPVSRFQIMLGRTLGGATVAFIQGGVVAVIAAFFGFRPVSLVGVLIGLAFMFLLGLLFSALGSAIAAKLNDMQSFPLIFNFLVMPLFFLSGAIYPVAGIPGWLHLITRLNPLIKHMYK